MRKEQFIYIPSTSHGVADYSDTATSVTPLVVTGGGARVKLTNDGLGAFTNLDHLPDGVGDVWNPVTSQFDFSDLPLGSVIHGRVDLQITTIGTNAEFRIEQDLAIGGFAYTLTGGGETYKSAGTYQFISVGFVYIGDDNTRFNPAELYCKCTNDCTVVVNGWALALNLK